MGGGAYPKTVFCAVSGGGGGGLACLRGRDAPWCLV